MSLAFLTSPSCSPYTLNREPYTVTDNYLSQAFEAHRCTLRTPVLRILVSERQASWLIMDLRGVLCGEHEIPLCIVSKDFTLHSNSTLEWAHLREIHSTTEFTSNSLGWKSEGKCPLRIRQNFARAPWVLSNSVSGRYR